MKRKLQFSSEGAAELTAFHKRVLDSLKIAFGVFMSGDVNDARKLIAEKAQLRNAELSAAEQHLERLREGRPESLETTSLHLDVLRDLKRIHSHICSVAYPVLDAAGEMPIADVAESDPITLRATGTKPAVADAFIQSGEIAQRHSELKERTPGGPAEVINTITFQPKDEPQSVWASGDLKVSAIRSTHIAGHASYRVDTPAGSVVIGGDAGNDIPAPPRNSSTSDQV